MADPIRVRLDCMSCRTPHVCGTATCEPLHHCCQACPCSWTPVGFEVVGAASSEDRNDAMVCYADGTEEDFAGVGFYFFDFEFPEEGVSGPFPTLEGAAREAVTTGGFDRVRFDPEALLAASGEVGVG